VKKGSTPVSVVTASTRKRIKTGVAILLLPFCFGTAEAVFRLIQSSGHAETVWVALIAGMACWLVIYLSLPKPMWVYVFGHELTHAIWTWLLGGKVKGFKATAKGGHVVVSRSNFVVALAPYFFPLYAVLILVLFAAGHRVWGWERYLVWFHLVLGAAYAFHVTLTGWVIRTRQSDIVDQGYLFSAVVIWLGNAAVLVLGIPILTGRIGILTAMGWCWINTGRLLQQLGRVL
jgi:hypothetical protein